MHLIYLWSENHIRTEIRSIIDIGHGFEYASGSEYARVPIMLLVLNIQGFCIYQNSEYAGYTRFQIYLNSIWITLIIHEYVWICLNLLESFVLHFPIVILRVLKRVMTYFYVYTKIGITVWKNMRLFSGRDKIWFFSITAVFDLTWFNLFV